MGVPSSAVIPKVIAAAPSMLAAFHIEVDGAAVARGHGRERDGRALPSVGIGASTTGAETSGAALNAPPTIT